MPSRRLFAILSILLTCIASSLSASAQEWPQRTVRLVIGYGAGGGTDIVGRIIAQALQEKFQQPFVVENKTGASGIIGADSVAKAAKDGYTLYLVNNAHIIVGVMTKTLPYDTLTSFEPVGQVATGSLAIVSHPSFAAKNVRELIEMAKANPGKITFASVGNGTTQHFTGELFKQVAGWTCSTFLIATLRPRWLGFLASRSIFCSTRSRLCSDQYSPATCAHLR